MEAFQGAIGIDLGTSYCSVAVWDGDSVTVILNEEGVKTTPSYVAFSSTERIVGDGAKAQASVNPSNTIFDAKRMIGRKYGDAPLERDIDGWPFRVTFTENGDPRVAVQESGSWSQYTPEEITAMVLSKMKRIAEAHLHREVKKAVITISTCATDAQRRATMDAAVMAGLEVVRLINEATAAAVAYGISKPRTAGEKLVLVFDLGGGVLDVSVVAADGGLLEVKATGGDSHLGGEDFDTRLMNFVMDEFKHTCKKDMSHDRQALRRLRTACERAKITLSTENVATISLPALHDDIDLHVEVARECFEELCADLFLRAVRAVERVLVDANTAPSQIHDIVLVGGSSRIPKMKELIAAYFGGNKPLYVGLNPDEAVAYGAAVEAFVLTGGAHPRLDGMLLMDVTPISLSVEAAEAEPTALQGLLNDVEGVLQSTCAESEYAEKLQRARANSLLDEDLVRELVLQTRVFELEERLDRLMYPALPLGAASRTDGMLSMVSMVPRNSTIPMKKERTFTTISDSQSIVTVGVYEGEGRDVRQCHLVGSLVLDNITSAPRGTTEIVVTFDVDANNILHVQAREKGTENKRQITLEDYRERKRNHLRASLQKYASDVLAEAQGALEWVSRNPMAPVEEYEARRKGLVQKCTPLVL